MRNVTLQCVSNFKLSLIMMATVLFILPNALKAQWGPNPANFSNQPIPASVPNSQDAYVVNTALLECTKNPGSGVFKEALSAIVWGTNTDEVHLYVEHVMRDLSSTTICHTMTYTGSMPTSIQLNNVGTQGQNPDVILRDHPNNPGVDYIVSVVYSENGGIYLEEYEITGITPGTASTPILTQIQKTLLITSTYLAGDIGSYPKIDGYVNPFNLIGDFFEMEGFVVTWETLNGVEVQAFDANAIPFYETFLNGFLFNPTDGHRPDVAAVVERTPTGFDKIAYIACFYTDPMSMCNVYEFNISSGITTPVSVTPLHTPTAGYPHISIDGMGIAMYPNTKWVAITGHDCNGGFLYSNTVNPMGQGFGPHNNYSLFHSYTVSAGVGFMANGVSEHGNEQYPFGMSTGFYPTNPTNSTVFLNVVDANTSLAFSGGGTFDDFCIVNNDFTTLEADIPYLHCGIGDYIGQSYSLSTASNSGYDLLGAWVDLGGGGNPPGIRYKYSCNGNMNLVAGTSPLVGQLNNNNFTDDINVYPNPVQDFLFVKLSETITPKVLSIYDIMGRRVLEKRLSENERVLGIDVQEYNSGTYRIDITDIKGKRYGKTVMVE